MTEDQARDLLASGYAEGEHSHQHRVQSWPLDALPYTDRIAIGILRGLNPEKAGKTVRWRCFHCDEGFTDAREAKLHFGPDLTYRPACHIQASHGGLLTALRDAEASAVEAWAAVHSESAEGVQAYRASLARHAVAVRSSEEAGYERGMADMTLSPEAAAELDKWRWAQASEPRAHFVEVTERYRRLVRENVTPETVDGN